MRLFLVALLLLSAFCYTQEKNKLDFEIIENVPVYEGCGHLSNNSALKQCMSEKINKLILREYNMSMANSLGLPEGIVNVFVAFKIDTEGKVIDIAARGPHPDLEKEIKRVIGLIPQLKPGYQRGEPVIVPYSLPVRLFIDNKIVQTYPIFKGCDKSLTYTEAKRCSVEKIKNFIKLSFDYDIADRALPTEKSTQFQLDFIVNKKGKVEDVNAKANHKAIAIEAIRAAKRLPKFKVPGKRNKKPIDTPMSITMTVYF